MPRKLAILVNLGTPQSLDTDAIRVWLREFLSDPRVVTLPRMLWLPILHCFILPFRPKRIREKYAQIWQEDSPLRLLTHGLADKTNAALGDEWEVRVAMTYGEPSLAHALQGADSFAQTVVLPLYPQYTGSTTGAVQDQVTTPLATPNLRFVESYHNRPEYIQALAASLNPRVEDMFTLFSFHGTPVAQAKHEPYEAQCRETAAAVAAAGKLADGTWDVAFQSRFGPFPWLQPYTEDVLTRLANEGQAVRVLCPGFAVECLETLEEIDLTYRAVYMEAGGPAFTYVPALNDSDAHAQLIAAILRNDPT
jgi:ferrochelatase